MNDVIEILKDNITIEGPLKFNFTKRAVNLLMETFPDTYMDILRDFSKSERILITDGNSIYFDEGLFAISNKKRDETEGKFQDGITLTHFRLPKLIEHNKALRSGIIIKVRRGIVLSAYIPDASIKFLIHNGNKRELWDFEKSALLRSADEISEKILKESEPPDLEEENEPDNSEEFIPSKKFEKLLLTAEQYSILSNDLDKKKANEINLPYIKVSSADFDRIDRIAYQFDVINYSEKDFKTGTQVEVEDKKGERRAGEIMNVLSDSESGEVYAVNILFNEEQALEDLNGTGFIYLTFSQVNMDVQTSAINKLREGSAPAGYMDLIFGEGKSLGFADKDLSLTEEKLMKKKYPPNPSQMNAIKNGINTNDIYLVMGPPGTGKTTVILEWVKYFVLNERKRVLISSQNNKAVDNVLARITEEKDIDVIRIGSESKVQMEVKPYIFENKIASVRKKIAESSALNLKTFNTLMSSGKKVSLSTLKAVEFRNELNRMRARFQEVTKERIQKPYSEIKETESEVMKEAQRIKKYINDLDEMNRFFENYQESNIFLKGYNYFKYREYKNSFTPLYKDYITSRANLEIMEDDYNSRIAEFKNILQKLYHEEYIPYRNKKTELAAYIDNLNEEILSLGSHYGFFDDIKNMEVTKDNLEEVHENIEEETGRTRIFLNELENWCSEMKDTQNYALNEVILESVNLVGATCIGTSSQKKFSSLDFDVTIIDEAGQIQVHNALVPMSVSNKLIMLGDHKQIPPVADEDLKLSCSENNVDTELLNKSLFEYMYGIVPPENRTMLDTQFRMPSEIAKPISDWFYGGEYLSHPSKDNIKGIIRSISDKNFIIIDTSSEPERFEKKVENSGSYNEMETDIIKNIVDKINLTGEVELNETGIISAYKLQVQKIKQALKETGRIDSDTINEMAATLDSFQGQERDLIIFSFTKSSDKSPYRKRIGFLNELRRLNVAVTRCKKTLILIGDFEFLKGCKNQDKDENDEPVYEKSEKEFSDFISLVYKTAAEGNGEIIDTKELFRRLENGRYE